MTSLNSLIEELSPLQVDHSSIELVCDFNRGKWIKANQLVNGPYPVITSGQKITEFHNEFNRSGESITIASSGAYAGFVNFWNQEIYLSNAFTADPKNPKQLLPKFLFYFLKENQSYIHGLASGGGVPNVYGHDLAGLRIPMPPIEIQHAIVKILDTFLALEAELEAELEVRKIQYEHYRALLLSFHSAAPDEVSWIPMGEVCEYRKERSKSSAGNFLYVGVEDLLQERRGVSDQARFVSSTGHDIFMPGDVILGNIRPYLKKVWHANVEGRTNGDVLVVTPKRDAVAELDSTYLYFLLSSDDFFSYCVQTSKGAKMPRGDKQAILRYEIPVPSIEVQRSIVKILSAFELLTQDLDSGLPAELAMRRKQYEYYRNKLLTFKETDAA